MSVRNASVILHPVNKKGKQEKGGLELKTNADGQTSYAGIPFGKLRVHGADALAVLERLCANRIDVPPGRAVYTAMLNARGGFESDLTVQRLGSDEFSSSRDALGIQSRSDARVFHKSHRSGASKTQSNFLGRPKKQTDSL